MIAYLKNPIRTHGQMVLEKPLWMAWAITLCFFIATTFIELQQKVAPHRLPFTAPGRLFSVLVVSMIVGILFVLFYAGLLRYASSIFGGKATWKEMMKVIGWSYMPILLVNVVFGIVLFIAPSKSLAFGSNICQLVAWLGVVVFLVFGIKALENYELKKAVFTFLVSVGGVIFASVILWILASPFRS